jgi:hypothetical protein
MSVQPKPIMGQMTNATAMAPSAMRSITARNVFVVLPPPANAMEEKAPVVGE